jgi:YHS domain-containing protein
MIRFFIIRVLLPLLAVLLVRSVVVTLLKAISQALAPQPSTAPQHAEGFQAGGELKKDPVCGTYVSPGAAVTTRSKGVLIHFCSPECRDKYRAT